MKAELSAEKIKEMLVGGAEKYSITIFDEIHSTNSYLKEKAEGLADGTVIIAKRQTAGRGRLGRSFVSDRGGLYMSLLIKPNLEAEKSIFLTTAAAVAVARAIEEVSGKDTGIKWVNDIFIDGKKVCGILTEGATNTEDGLLQYAVIGIGINVTEPEGGFAKEIADIAISVFGKASPENAENELAAKILNQLSIVLNSPQESEILDQYRQRSIVIGKKVDIIYEDASLSATVTGIDDSAAIILKTEDGKIIRKTSGEISVRI